MNSLIAKRKKATIFDISKDIFIFGLYPFDPCKFIEEEEPLFNPNDQSFFPSQEESNFRVLSNFYDIEENQEKYLLFYKSSIDNKIITKYEWIVPNNEEQLKQIHEYKEQLIKVDPEMNIYSNQKSFSIFSCVNDEYVLSDEEYNTVLDCLKQIHYQQKEYLTEISDFCIICSVLSHLERFCNVNGPFLVITDLQEDIGVIYNLFRKWSKLRVLAMIGSNNDILNMKQYIFPFTPVFSNDMQLNFFKYNVLITIKDIYSNELSYFNKIKWAIVIKLDKSLEPSNHKKIANFTFSFKHYV